MLKQQKRIMFASLVVVIPVALFVLGAAFLESYSSDFD
jgi:hypothetical protein